MNRYGIFSLPTFVKFKVMQQKSCSEWSYTLKINSVRHFVALVDKPIFHLNVS